MYYAHDGFLKKVMDYDDLPDYNFFFIPNEKIKEYSMLIR
jgi:hypothetical protein